MSEIYDISNYSREDLYNILEVSSPTDSELEAKIIQLMQKYKNGNNKESEKMLVFFSEIYKYFFKTNVEETKEEEEEKEEITYIKDLNYTQGIVNPILKETYKRTISIDSKFRDEEYESSTNFVLNFSETLKDVVSLKLYAVQIPVTWYTINNNYGSNYFMLRPRNIYDVENIETNTLGIYDNSDFEYKVEIEAGNYTQTTLISEVDEKIKGLKDVYTDVSFGLSGIEYSQTNAKANIIIDIQNVYNEYNYEISITESLRSVLGMERLPQSIGTIISIIETIPVGLIIKLTSENNKIKLVQYSNDTNITDISDSTKLDEIEITIPSILYDNNDLNSYGSNELIENINNAFTNNEYIVGSKLEYKELENDKKQWELLIKINRKKINNIVNSKWYIEFPNTNDITDDFGESSQVWSEYFGFQSLIYELSVFNSENIKDLEIIEGEKKIIVDEMGMIKDEEGVIIDIYGEITFSAKEESVGVYNSNKSNDLNIEVSGNNIDDIISEINIKMNENNIFNGSEILKESNENETKLRINFNINKVYTSSDYEIVFYDVLSFSRCSDPKASYKNVSIDSTLGYILGYHTLTNYPLISEEVEVNNKKYYINPNTGLSTKSEYVYEKTTLNNSVIKSKYQLKGDSVLSIYLYNYFMIILDDFNQNHLNDGLVTVAKKDKSVTLPEYANRKNFKICDEGIKMDEENTKKLTQKQVYSVSQILETQNSLKSNFNDGLFIKDMFALLPVKASGVTPGNIYVEFGGTLQQQERTYFGPVNISRLSVKLMNDKGNIVDLNGANWSFQLVCEQLYKKGEIKK